MRDFNKPKTTEERLAFVENMLANIEEVAELLRCEFHTMFPFDIDDPPRSQLIRLIKEIVSGREPPATVQVPALPGSAALQLISQWARAANYPRPAPPPPPPLVDYGRAAGLLAATELGRDKHHQLVAANSSALAVKFEVAPRSNTRRPEHVLSEVVRIRAWLFDDVSLLAHPVIAASARGDETLPVVLPIEPPPPDRPIGEEDLYVSWMGEVAQVSMVREYMLDEAQEAWDNNHRQAE